jgi:hypothetical protein
MGKRRNATQRQSRRLGKLVTWAIVGVVVGGIIWGLSLSGGVAYGEREIAVVDFSFLNEQQKQTALVAANRARCICGCGLGLAQCVATDATCPIRTTNIERIRTMVREAAN